MAQCLTLCRDSRNVLIPFFSSQWLTALPEGISGAYPAVPPQVRSAGKMTAGASPSTTVPSTHPICCRNLEKRRPVMLVHRGLCVFQIVGTILCSCGTMAHFPRVHCETCIGTLKHPHMEVGDVHCPSSQVLRAADGVRGFSVLNTSLLLPTW